ncbi:amidase [Sinosporangium siamense]|uniref:Amidase n=1 Tax=Sinosporangium siamense TaxID=1367973 RepID=A0A919VDZ7_9ACTN|nr:amidase [Sinosporangium siamense]GII94624.1 amidase [Sinosporangium siamense]
MTDPVGTGREGWPTASELAEHIRAGKVGSREIVEGYLARIEKIDPALNAFCHVTPDEARQAADAADAQVRQGGTLPPFHGVPIAIKDLHPVRGWPLCSASNGVGHEVMKSDALAVRALREAGFVFVGATTSPEFGTVSVTESDRHGATRNPWDLAYSPGGSSGGSAAAVAAGLVPVGHASDGAGSIREPASYCGLVGMKPSRGLVPADAHYMEGFATEGVLTRTVLDTAAILDVFAAAPRPTWYAPPRPETPFQERALRDPGRLRIGLNLQPAFHVEVDPAARDTLRRAADMIADLGHEVVEQDIPGLDPDWFAPRFDIFYSTGSADCAVVDESAVEPLNRTLRQAARETDSLTYVTTILELQLRSAEMYKAWDSVDVLLTPTNPVLAPRVGSLWEGQETDPWVPLRRALQTASLTALGNMLGLPAISVPLVPQPGALPLGVQLIGGRWQDGTVLALAGQLERAYPWRHRTPAGLPL